jgi:hypothetical protein
VVFEFFGVFSPIHGYRYHRPLTKGDGSWVLSFDLCTSTVH